MKKLTICLAVMIHWLFIGAVIAQDPFPPGPIACEGGGYIVKNQSGFPSGSTLYKVDQAGGSFTFTLISDDATIPASLTNGGGDIQVSLNNMGFRVEGDKEGYLYAIAHPISAPTTNVGIVKIDNAGEIVGYIATPGSTGTGITLPTTRFVAGGITRDGSTMYISAYASTTGSNLYVYDFDTDTVTAVAKGVTGTETVDIPSGGIRVADWAVSPYDGLLYGASSQPFPEETAGVDKGRLWQLNPVTGDIKEIPVAESVDALVTSNDFNDTGAYGGCAFNADGRFFVYQNLGAIWAIDLLDTVVDNDPPFLNDEAVIVNKLIEGPSSALNDGTACSARVALLEVKKEVSIVGADGPWFDANDPTGPMLLADEDVWYRITLVNTGTVTVVITSVEDLTTPDAGDELESMILAELPVLPFEIPPIVSDKTIEIVVGPVSAQEGQVTNTVTFEAMDAGKGIPPDQDPELEELEVADDANYFGVDVAIDVEKFVTVVDPEDPGFELTDWIDADDAPGLMVEGGGQVWYGIIITNTGNVDLTGITLTDALYQDEITAFLGGDPIPNPLTPSSTHLVVIGPYDVEDVGNLNVENTAEVDGIGFGEDVEDSDPANYTVTPRPEIDVEKLVSSTSDVGPWYDADSAPGLIVTEYDQVWFKIVVTNPGNVDLTDVSLTDTMYPDELAAALDTALGAEGSSPYDHPVGVILELVVGPFDVEGNPGETVTNLATAGDGETEDEDEANYTVQYVAFTPGFWKNHAGEDSHNANKGKGKGKVKENAWPVAFNPTDTLADVFAAAEVDEQCVTDALAEDVPEKNGFYSAPDVVKTFGELTLIEALQLKGGGGVSGASCILLRAGVASILNAQNGAFPGYDADYIIEKLGCALCSGDAMLILELASVLDDMNNGIPADLDLWICPSP